MAFVSVCEHEVPETSKGITNEELEKASKELISMWEQYRVDKIYDNPVLLPSFFAMFTAEFGYFYVIVNKQKLLVDSAVIKQTADIYNEYKDASVTERDGVIRRAERSTRSLNEYYISQVSWAKGCINQMQTLLRLMGDESKMTGRT